MAVNPEGSSRCITYSFTRNNLISTLLAHIEHKGPHSNSTVTNKLEGVDVNHGGVTCLRGRHQDYTMFRCSSFLKSTRALNFACDILIFLMVYCGTLTSPSVLEPIDFVCSWTWSNNKFIWQSTATSIPWRDLSSSISMNKVLPIKSDTLSKSLYSI